MLAIKIVPHDLSRHIPYQDIELAGLGKLDRPK
jgi:hypothetical protein